MENKMSKFKSSEKNGLDLIFCFTLIIYSFLIKLFTGITVDSHRVLRKNIEIPCLLYAVSPNCSILQNYSTVSQPGC